MTDETIKRRLLESALPFVADEGWGWGALAKGAEALDSGSLPQILFVDGLESALESLMAWLDEESDAAMAAYRGTLAENEKARVSVLMERALTARLTLMAHHRLAFQHIIRYLLHPARLGLALRLSYRTVNTLWYKAGDQSTDFNFYSKRFLLAYVYDATVIHFLKSSTLEEDVMFLKKRLGDVARLPKFKEKLKSLFGRAAVGCLLTLSSADAAVLSLATQKRLEKALDSIHTMQAHFDQTNPDGGHSAGQFFLTRPDHMRFSYTVPEGHFIVADQEWVALYDPDLKDYSAVSVESTPARFFLRDSLSLEGDIRVKDIEESKDTITLVLTDPQDTATVTLLLAKKPFHIKGWTIVDGQGHVTEIKLKQVILNKPIDASHYRMPKKPKRSA